MAAKRHLLAKDLHAAFKNAEDKEVRPGHNLWHVGIGQLVHECAGDLAEIRMEPTTKLAGAAIEWANLHARDTRVFGNLSKARAQIAGNVCAYLTKYAPGPDAQYLGSELAFDGGRVDLVWFIPDFGIVIDEIKTVSWVNLNVDARMLDQVLRYREFGVAEWGDMFAGVRFLPLRHPHEAKFISPDGTVGDLSKSTAAAAMARSVA